MGKRHSYILFIAMTAIWAVISCTEKTDLRSSGEYKEYIAVDATLTDRADRPQRVILTKTVPYFGDAEDHANAAVRGATVTVDDGESTVLFSEKDPGVYEAPEGYCAEEGKKYHLRIENGENTYEAEALMPEGGFSLDDIDYAWAGNKTMGVDSLWTIAVWGNDRPQASYYYITVAVNGNYYPFDLAEVIDDKYFNGNKVTGFPITTLMQIHDLQEMYGDCCKYLEEGDVITLEAMTLQKDYFDYLIAVELNGTFSSIPLFSPQPANCPTNIKGEGVVGYFAVCPTCSASVTVDDPLRPYYKKLLGSLPF